MGARRRTAPDFDPKAYAAVGSARDIVQRCREYVEAGVSKFVMIPLAQGDDDLFEQTRRLVAEVIPEVSSSP